MSDEAMRAARQWLRREAEVEPYDGQAERLARLLDAAERRGWSRGVREAAEAVNGKAYGDAVTAALSLLDAPSAQRCPGVRTVVAGPPVRNDATTPLFPLPCDDCGAELGDMDEAAAHECPSPPVSRPAAQDPVKAMDEWYAAAKSSGAVDLDAVERVLSSPVSRPDDPPAQDGAGPEVSADDLLMRHVELLNADLAAERAARETAERERDEAYETARRNDARLARLVEDAKVGGARVDELTRERDAARAEAEAMRGVVEAARAWWMSRRPVTWGETAHAANPHVNLTTDAEVALADALARLDASQRETDGASDAWGGRSVP